MPVDDRRFERTAFAAVGRSNGHHDVSILITGGIGVALHLGVAPRANVSMMIMRPPQHGHGRGSTRGSSIAASGVSDCFGRDGTASSLRACAMFAARLPLASSP